MKTISSLLFHRLFHRGFRVAGRKRGRRDVPSSIMGSLLSLSLSFAFSSSPLLRTVLPCPNHPARPYVDRRLATSVRRGASQTRIVKMRVSNEPITILKAKAGWLSSFKLLR